MEGTSPFEVSSATCGGQDVKGSLTRPHHQSTISEVAHVYAPRRCACQGFLGCPNLPHNLRRLKYIMMRNSTLSFTAFAEPLPMTDEGLRDCYYSIPYPSLAVSTIFFFRDLHYTITLI